jgi:hypothetical protein
VLERHGAYLAQEALVEELAYVALGGAEHREALDLDDESFEATLARV